MKKILLEPLKGLREYEEIRDIIALSTYPERLGVCIDTCHCFAAGYDIRTPQGYEQVMERFGKVIGFGKLEGMHLNDSKGKLASHVDRHAPLGKGEIGLVPFALIDLTVYSPSGKENGTMIWCWKIP